MSFKDFLIEAKKENRKILHTKHSMDRVKDDDRFGQHIKKEYGSIEKFKAKVEMVVRRSMKRIIRNHKDVAGKYGVRSKSTGIGAIVDWDKHIEGDDSNHAKIVTVLPIRDSHSYKPGTIEVVVENETYEIVDFIEVE